MPLLRTLLVDDDDIVREVLTIRLARHRRLQIVGAVGSGEEALIAADSLRPDLIVLDLCLPGLSGIDALRSLVQSLPRVGVVVLSARQSPAQVQQAFALGAAGYVFKPSSGSDLLEAVQAVIAGRRYSSPALNRPPHGAGSAQVPTAGAAAAAPNAY